MFPDLAKLMPQFQSGMADLKNCLAHLYQEAQQARIANQAAARSLSFEFGVVDDDPTGRLSPRRLSALPVIIEQTVTVQTELDVQTLNQGRPISRGFYANLGENPFQVILHGLNGSVSAQHTVPPGTTISITCWVDKLSIVPGTGAAFFQVYGQ